MARNRKRAKDRRPRRPPQGGSPESGVPSDRPSVPGVLPPRPTVTREPLPELEPEENGAPAPLEHAMPDGELAEEQLAIGRPLEPEPGDEADEEELELEVEESIAEQDGGGGAAAGWSGVAAAGRTAAVRWPCPGRRTSRPRPGSSRG